MYIYIYIYINNLYFFIISVIFIYSDFLYQKTKIPVSANEKNLIYGCQFYEYLKSKKD